MMGIEYSQEMLGKKLAQIRESRKLSQSALAKEMPADKGSPSYISDLENGRGRSVSMAMLVAIADGLGCTCDELLMDSLTIYDQSENPYRHMIDEQLHTCTQAQLDLFYEIVEAYVRCRKTR